MKFVHIVAANLVANLIAALIIWVLRERIANVARG